MIIDAHHHLWKFNTEDYGWIDDSMAILKRDYLPADLRQHLQEAEVGGTVVVQARQKLEETRWLLEMAHKNSFISGVVGWLDLRSDKLLEQLEEFAGNPKFVGVRHVIHDEPDDDFMLRTAFLNGIEKLAKYNLSFDLLLFPKHLQGAMELVSMFPEQKFVLDHLSKPFIKAGILDPWREDLESLAAQPNVWCKISGMVTEANVNNWRYEDFIPYLDVVLEAFGTDRLMLGSDWPVCLLGGEYHEILAIPLRYFKDMEPVCKEKIFRGNAIECYNLSIKLISTDHDRK
jgi:L-fuconolactonase